MSRTLYETTSLGCAGYRRKKLGETTISTEIGTPITYIDENGEIVDTGKVITSTDIDDFDPINSTLLNSGTYSIVYE